MSRDPDGKPEVADHSPDDGELLPVLLPEDRDVGADDLEKQCHNRANTVEVPGPFDPFKARRKMLFRNRHGGVGCVHPPDIGTEEEIHSLAPAQRRVGADRPGITGKILLGTELRRIHENRDRHGPLFSCKSARLADEGDMPRVESPHGGDMDDCAPDFFPPGRDGSGRGRRVHAPT
jgi:hypothetical protein